MIWSILTHRLAGPVATGVAALAIVATGVQTARLHFAEGRADRCEKRERDAKGAAEKKTQAGKTITATVAGDLRAKTVEIQWRTRTLIKEVPTYVTPDADDRCVIPVGFVRLHDAAASGLPVASGGPVEAPSGVELSTVAGTVATNYGAALEWRAEAQAWRDWYEAQAETWSAR